MPSLPTPTYLVFALSSDKFSLTAVAADTTDPVAFTYILAHLVSMTLAMANGLPRCLSGRSSGTEGGRPINPVRRGHAD
jgi:hypothetical protein